VNLCSKPRPSFHGLFQERPPLVRSCLSRFSALLPFGAPFSKLNPVAERSGLAGVFFFCLICKKRDVCSSAPFPWRLFAFPPFFLYWSSRGPDIFPTTVVFLAVISRVGRLKTRSVSFPGARQPWPLYDISALSYPPCFLSEPTCFFLSTVWPRT